MDLFVSRSRLSNCSLEVAVLVEPSVVIYAHIA